MKVNQQNKGNMTINEQVRKVVNGRGGVKVVTSKSDNNKVRVTVWVNDSSAFTSARVLNQIRIDLVNAGLPAPNEITRQTTEMNFLALKA